jgi:hypothetical protein
MGGNHGRARSRPAGRFLEIGGKSIGGAGGNASRHFAALTQIAFVSDLIRPDHSEGTGQAAQAASGALLHIKGGALSIFIQSFGEADDGTGGILTVMA